MLDEEDRNDDLSPTDSGKNVPAGEEVSEGDADAREELPQSQASLDALRTGTFGKVAFAALLYQGINSSGPVDIQAKPLVPQVQMAEADALLKRLPSDIDPDLALVLKEGDSQTPDDFEFQKADIEWVPWVLDKIMGLPRFIIDNPQTTLALFILLLWKIRPLRAPTRRALKRIWSGKKKREFGTDDDDGDDGPSAPGTPSEEPPDLDDIVNEDAINRLESRESEFRSFYTSLRGAFTSMKFERADEGIQIRNELFTLLIRKEYLRLRIEQIEGILNADHSTPELEEEYGELSRSKRELDDVFSVNDFLIATLTRAGKKRVPRLSKRYLERSMRNEGFTDDQIADARRVIDDFFNLVLLYDTGTDLRDIGVLRSKLNLARIYRDRAYPIAGPGVPAPDPDAPVVERQRYEKARRDIQICARLEAEYQEAVDRMGGIQNIRRRFYEALPDNPDRRRFLMKLTRAAIQAGIVTSIYLLFKDSDGTEEEEDKKDDEEAPPGAIPINSLPRGTIQGGEPLRPDMEE